MNENDDSWQQRTTNIDDDEIEVSLTKECQKDDYEVKKNEDEIIVFVDILNRYVVTSKSDFFCIVKDFRYKANIYEVKFDNDIRNFTIISPIDRKDDIIKYFREFLIQQKNLWWNQRDNWW